MNLLEKIETYLNVLLLKLGELMLKALPGPIRAFFSAIANLWNQVILFFKKLPLLFKNLLLGIIGKVRNSLADGTYKTALKETYHNAITQYKARRSNQSGKLKTFLLTPFLVLGQWLQGLSTNQAALLLTFSGASFLAVIGIGFSGKKLLAPNDSSFRSPASTEEILYDRPLYYKKEKKHLEITNLRLPVYIPKVNQIRSVDIDFTATLSNRYSRKYLEKHEFHLRDHLILQLEPSIAAFSLEEEGKEIIRQKLLFEINNYLKANHIEGEVLDLKITYILAN